MYHWTQFRFLALPVVRLKDIFHMISDTNYTQLYCAKTKYTNFKLVSLGIQPLKVQRDDVKMIHMTNVCKVAGK